MGWKEVGTEKSSNSTFLRLKDGEKARVHVISEEPFSFLSCFFQELGKNAVCRLDEKNKYPKGMQWRTQHALVVYNMDAKQPMIWIVGNQVAEQIKNIHEQYKGLHGVDLSIKREGSKLNTRYAVIPLPSQYQEQDIDWPDLEKQIASTPPKKVNEMLNGVDSDTEFEPEELEYRATTKVDGEEEETETTEIENDDQDEDGTDKRTQNQSALELQAPGTIKRGRGRPPKPVEPTNGQEDLATTDLNNGEERSKLLSAIVAGWQDQKFRANPGLRAKIMQIAAGGKAVLAQCSVQELRQILVSQQEA